MGGIYGFAKYYVDMVLAQSDRDYIFGSEHLKGRIKGAKIGEEESAADIIKIEG